MSDRLGTAVLTLVTNTKDFDSGLTSAAQRMAGLKRNFEDTGTSLDKVAFGMSQAGKEASASSKMIQGMSQVGRVELERLNPPTNQVTQSMIALGAAAGTFIGQVAYDAIRRVATSLTTLVSEGFKLASTRDSFHRLSASIGETADAMLGATRTATKGLITDLNIMASANKAMLLGLPVTSQEFGTLSAAAVTLGKAMGQGATKSLDDLITALGRSSPLILDNLGLTVKVGEANEKYAAQVGKSVGALTDAEKKMAFYRAAVEAAQDKVQTLGGVQLTLADQATRVGTAFANNAHTFAGFLSTAVTPLTMALSALPQPLLQAGVALTTLVAGITATKLAMTGLTAAFAAGGPAAGALAVGMTALSASIGLVSTALSFLVATPIGLALVALAGLAAGFIYLRKQTDISTDGMFELAGGVRKVNEEHERLVALLGKTEEALKRTNAEEQNYHTNRQARIAASIQARKTELELEMEAAQAAIDAGTSGASASDLMLAARQRLLARGIHPVTTGLIQQARIELELKQQIDETNRALKEREAAAKKIREFWEEISNASNAMAWMQAKLQPLPAAISSVGSALDHVMVSVRFTKDEMLAFAMGMPQVVTNLEKVSGTLVKSRGAFQSLTDGVKNSLSDLWAGMSGGRGFAGLMNNLGSSIVDGFGSILSGGLTSVINMGVQLAIEGVKKIAGLISGLFKSEESKHVNKPRDQFFAQYGGFEGLAAKLGEKVDGNTAEGLIRTLYDADTKAKFSSAQDAIIALIGGQKFAKGGFVTGPTFGLIGEQGPELVMPLDRFEAIVAQRDTAAVDAVRSELAGLHRDMRDLPFTLVQAWKAAVALS